MGLLPSDSPVGPGNLIKSRNSRARDTWQKRRRGNRGGLALSSPITAASSAPRASQNSNPARSADSRTTCQTEDLLHISTRTSSSKSSLDKTGNGSRRLKKKLVSPPRFVDPKQDTPEARKMSRKYFQLLLHSNPDPFGG